MRQVLFPLAAKVVISVTFGFHGCEKESSVFDINKLCQALGESRPVSQQIAAEPGTVSEAAKWERGPFTFPILAIEPPAGGNIFQSRSIE